MVFLSLPRRLFLFLLIAGLEETKNLRGGNVLRLRVVQIRFNGAQCGENLARSSSQFVAGANRRLEFQKCCFGWTC